MTKPPEVIGHRGCAGLEPENTIRAFRRASEIGCAAVELDIRLSKEGHVMVIHDETVDRTTDGSGGVADLTAAEFARLDAGGGDPVPRLAEVFETLGDTGLLFQIELKGRDTEEPVAELVRQFGMVGRVRFTSFFHRRVARMRELLPDARRGLLVACNPLNPCRLVQEAGATSLHVDARRIDAELVDRVHRCGAEVIAWGRIETPELARFLVVAGVDAIGSDRPDIVIAALSDSQFSSTIHTKP